MGLSIHLLNHFFYTIYYYIFFTHHYFFSTFNAFMLIIILLKFFISSISSVWCYWNDEVFSNQNFETFRKNWDSKHSSSHVTAEKMKSLLIEEMEVQVLDLIQSTPTT